MALYVKPENQTHLWNTIHSHPKFQPYIRQYPPEKINAWFRSTIEGFYRNWGEHRPMTQNELKQLNQNTVASLYQSIVSLNTPASNPTPAPTMIPHPPIHAQATVQQQFQQHPSLPKPLPDFQGQHEFEQRAQEYQAMNSKPAAAPLQGQTDADQRESQDAMERKWMEQQRLREKDIEQFSPPSQVNGAQAINLNLLKSTAPPSGTPDKKEETETILLKIREINESKEIPFMETTEKEPVKEPVKDMATVIEPEWLKRIERMEQLQEKMYIQMEKLLQHILSTTTAPTSSIPNDKKMGDIDE